MPSKVNCPTVRAAIYARYSSDNQREASIEDQVEVCRRHADLQGWEIVEVYPDYALSGASRFRPAFEQMQVDAEARRFDVIRVEALDRLSRKLADVSHLHDRLTFFGIRLHAVATGEVTGVHVGMLGTMAQMYLKDLAEKTKRGQLGRALKGKIPGGKAYGYDVLPAGAEGAGQRSINAAEAAVVRRIFELFAAGVSPREIAKRLNAEQVPGPDGRPWGDTTIRGQADRGTGILNNALYVGRLEWNPLLVCQGPAHGQEGRSAEPARAVGDRAGTRAAHRQRRAVGRRQGAPGRGEDRHVSGCRRQCPQPGAPAQVPAERSARMRGVWRWLHHHRRCQLRLRDTPLQGHLQQPAQGTAE